ncbi:MAG: DUF5690 family protein [Planctomycetota bacterium]
MNSGGTSRFGPIWWTLAAFGTYFCMYAFRKPFTAAAFSDVALFGFDYKTIAVTAQVLGYMVSKFIGIKVIAEMPAGRRALGILILIGCSELALIGFGMVPAPYNIPFLFLNGLPLGIVFGLVLGFLEGRRQTELLTAGLCASFILADGVTKSVGTWVMAQGVSEFWMPACTGLMFTLPLLVCVGLLSQVPPPDSVDVLARSPREPLDQAARRRFFTRHAMGLSLLVTVYLLITILRSIRADFAPEIWRSLDVTVASDLFTRSELIVAAGVIVVNGLTAFIKDNQRAFHTAIGISLVGLTILMAALAGLQFRAVDGFTFMVLIGLGLYLPYVAFHTTVFERLIAVTRDRGNIGYLMYLADAFGYLGYVAVMLGRSAFPKEASFRVFFVGICGCVGGLAIIILCLAWYQFASRSLKTRLT